MLPRFFLFFFFLLAAPLMAPVVALAAPPAQDIPDAPFKAIYISRQEKIEQWDKRLDDIQNLLDTQANIIPRASELRSTLLSMRAAVLEEKDVAETATREASSLLAALQDVRGSLVADDLGADESGEVAKDPHKKTEPFPTLSEGAAILKQKKEYYQRRLEWADLYLAQTRLILLRVDTLNFALARTSRRQMIKGLVRTNPAPFLPATVHAAGGELIEQLGRLAHSPIAWYKNLERGALTEALTSPFLWGYLCLLLPLVAVGIASGRFAKRLVLAGKGDPLRRAVLTGARFVAQVAVPCGIIGGAWFLIGQSFLLFSGLFPVLLSGLCFFFILALASFSVPRIFLLRTFGMPLCARITCLGIVFAFDSMVFNLSKALGPSEELFSTSVFCLTLLEAALTLSAINLRWWRLEDGMESWQEEGSPEGAAPGGSFLHRASRRPRGLWQLGRVLILATFLLSLTLQTLGYGRLGSYIIHSLTGTILTTGAFLVAARYLRECFAVFIATDFARKWIGLSEEGEGIFQFWISAFFSIVFAVLWCFSIIMVWDLPLLQTWLQFLTIFYGFPVGEATISLKNILLSFVGLLASLLCFRLVKRLLEERIMPRLILDTGIRYSIISMFGYSGVIISFLIALRIVGVNLQSMIIISASFFLGAGLALRNVVENFISGLILLFERPIKIGDMVEVGPVQGYVTRIHIRATQVMTFDRSEVVLPNAAIVSTGITNWTHSNRQARLCVSVGVEYGSNINLVQELLFKVASSNSQVLKRPIPEVLLMEFGESCLRFELRCFVNDATTRLSVSSELRYEIDRIFRHGHIVIANPRRNIRILPPPEHTEKEEEASEGAETLK